MPVLIISVLSFQRLEEYQCRLEQHRLLERLEVPPTTPPVTPPIMSVTTSRGLPVTPPVTPPIILVTVSIGLVEPTVPVTNYIRNCSVVVCETVSVTVEITLESKPVVETLAMLISETFTLTEEPVFTTGVIDTISQVLSNF